MAEPTPEAAAAPEARPVPVANPWIAAFAAWMIPGAGHWFLGHRRRAVAFFVLVAVALAVGLALDGKLYRPIANQPLQYLGTLGSMGLGLAYFLLRYALGYTGEVIAPGYEYGTAFILTAGLMNLLLVLDAWDIALGKKE